MPEGLSLKQVKKELESRGLKTAKGKDTWTISSIRSILTNEKYKGDALLQKTFTVDFLTKEKKKNEGEVPQYYVHNNHPAIVDAATWDEVQYILKTSLSCQRKSQNYFLSGRLTCGCCGGVFGTKVFHSNDKYRKVVWQCNDKYKGEKICKNRNVTEEMVHQAFIEALNKLLQKFGNQEMLKEVLDEVFDVSKANQSIDKQIQLIEQLQAELDGLIAEQQTVKLTADEFSSKVAPLEAKLHRAQRQLSKKQVELADLKAKKASILRALNLIKEPLVTEFCTTYWMAFVEQALILPDRIEFKMRLGGTTSQKLSSSSS